MTTPINSIYMLSEKMSITELLETIKCTINNIFVLVAIVDSDDFLNFDERIIRNYFCIIESFASEAKELIELFSTKLTTDS